MSDDEKMPQGEMGDEMGGLDGDDMSDEDGGYPGQDELPDGIKKEMITESPSGNFKNPKVGDDVTVHYVGTLEDGSEFDSSRSRGKPFNFMLGKGQVIKGWDEGVKTMKKGEVAKFVLSPEFAYGAEGSPPKIPANATLTFEVELISWVSKDDLFSDGGVIKDEVKDGSGWKKPKDGDEIKISMKACNPDDTVIEEKVDLEYVIGSGVLGSLSKAVDAALTSMKKGEEAKLTCKSEYAYGDSKPDGAIIYLTLQEVYEIKDISFSKDKTMMKKQIQEGDGFEQPKDAAKVTLKVEAATDGSAPIAGFTAQTLEFTVGNGEVCDALELLTTEMKKGEKSVLTCLTPALCEEQKLGLGALKGEKIILHCELLEFDKGKDTWSLSEDEKIAFGVERKAVGSELFKKGRTRLALDRYKKVGELFNYVDNFNEENKAKAKELKKVCELNQGACYVKLGNFTDGKKACNNVLKDDRDNVKALYRRGQCDLELKNFSEVMADMKKIIDLDPQNKPARALYKSAQVGQKAEDKKSQGLFVNMCKALGKGPIPEPGKAKAIAEDDEDDDDEDEDMEEAKAESPANAKAEEPKAEAPPESTAE